jgi:Kef-type K+ transport system membrane component KefB/mannitol/fructose-specific phosphotransferase system IIA component (Ntr-type)
MRRFDRRKGRPVLRTLEPTQLGVMLLSLALLIGVARLLGEVARRFHQPAILGELLAGVLLGPTVLGSLAPEWQAFLFPREGPNAIVLDGIGSLAIVLFLLVAGMEVDLSIVWKQGKSALKVGTLGTAIPFAIGLLGAIVMPRALGRQVDADPTIFALFLATAMAISALPVIAKTLMDLDLYRTDLGMVVVSAAIFNDLIGWTIFALILGLMGTHGSGLGIAMTLALTLLYAGLTLTMGRWLMHRTLPFIQAYTHYPGGVLGFAVTLGLLGAALTEFIGIHAIFGAFLIGVAFGDSSHLSERTRVMIDEFISFIFAPIFFASIGLKVNFITHFDILVVLPILSLTIAGKLSGAVLGARWGGFATRERWAVGFGISATGAMGIILGTMALEAGIIRQRLFVALVVTAIVTSGLSGPLIRRTLRRRQPYRILTFLSSKMFIRNLCAESRLDAIRELAAIAAQQARLDAGLIEQLAWEREQTAATGIGNGVAIPHARLPELKEPVIVVGVSEAGIAFDAPDGQPAHVVFLLVTPRNDPAAQLDLSANIAHIFRGPGLLERVLRAASFTELAAALKMVSPK